MKTLYLFLDFDGVLNNANEDFGRDELDRLNQSNLDQFDILINKLKENFEIKIVINSAWKMNIFKGRENWLDLFINRIKPLIKYRQYIIDTTPTYRFWQKGYDCKRFEVEAWVAQQLYDGNDAEFLILDDELIKNKGCMEFIKIYRTDCNVGLTNIDVDNICDMLIGDISEQ